MRLALFTLWLLVASGASAEAVLHLSPWRVEVIESESGEYILVLLVDSEGQTGLDELLQDEETLSSEQARLVAERELEARYAVSGLYRNDGSTTPLWTVDPIAICNEVIVADDGIHLMKIFTRWDEIGVSSRCHAVEIYASGNLIAKYREEQLLSGYWLRFLCANATGGAYPRATGFALDNSTGILWLVTNQGDRFQFDITTGDLVASKSPWQTGILATAIAIAISAVALLAWWVKRRGSAKEKTP